MDAPNVMGCLCHHGVGVSIFIVFVVSCVSLSGCDPVFRVSIRLGCGCVVCLGFRMAFS
jgi:hypothetical protein